MVQFILDNLEIILLIYFFVNTFIAGYVFREVLGQVYSNKWRKIIPVLSFLFFGIFLLLFFFVHSFFSSLYRKLNLNKVWNLYFSSNLKKGVLIKGQVDYVNRIAKYHKNSNSLGDRIYRWYAKRINERYEKQ
jgi:hypothetical protein